MGRFYKTHTRWIADKPVKKAEVVSAIEEKKVEVSEKEEPVIEKAQKEEPVIEKAQKEEPVIEKAPVVTEEAPVAEAKPAEAMIIEKTETEEGIVCEIITELDCDEIRYNIGSKKVTEKNKSRCKRYEGKFVLEEPAVINASAFKEDILVCSVQG